MIDACMCRATHKNDFVRAVTRANWKPHAGAVLSKVHKQRRQKRRIINTQRASPAERAGSCYGRSEKQEARAGPSWARCGRIRGRGGGGTAGCNANLVPLRPSNHFPSKPHQTSEDRRKAASRLLSQIVTRPFNDRRRRRS